MNTDMPDAIIFHCSSPASLIATLFMCHYYHDAELFAMLMPSFAAADEIIAAGLMPMIISSELRVSFSFAADYGRRY